MRNELADLTDMGYLEQPHTSAGRIPSARGYRLYVNELMDRKTLSEMAIHQPAAFAEVVEKAKTLEHHEA